MTHNNAQKNAHKTAITRTKVNAPLRFLEENGLINGRTLDYGCGKGFSADRLNMDKFDPFYYDDEITGRYDVITCNYVLNVLERTEQMIVLRELALHLKTNGVAYITVRRDIKVDGYTKRGTYQCNVELDLPIVFKQSGFCIYELKKSDIMGGV